MGRIAVLLAMSHNEVMDHGTAQEHLRDMMSAVSKPPRPNRGVIGTKQSNAFGVIINQGRIVFEYAKMMMGDEVMSQVVKGETKMRLPRGFWPACCRHCLHRVCTDALRKSLSKALHFYIRSLRKGATTTCGMLFNKKGGTAEIECGLFQQY